MAAMVEGVSDSQVIHLIATLESDDEVVEPILRRVRSEIPSYQAVGREQIVASVHRILRRACRTLRAGEVPPPDEFWEAERATVERLRAGVPIEDIMAGFRVTIASIQGRLVELAVECGVDGADVVALTSLLWRLSDAFSARAAADYHRQGLTLAMADQRRRDEWLAGALAGDLDSAQLERGYTVYRLRRDTTYRAFCTGPGEEQRIEQVQRAIAEHHGHGVLMAPTRDRLVGIMENLPTPVPGQLIALGAPAPVIGSPRLIGARRMSWPPPCCSTARACTPRRPWAGGSSYRRLVSWVSCYGCATSSHFTAQVLSATRSSRRFAATCPMAGASPRPRRPCMSTSIPCATGCRASRS